MKKLLIICVVSLFFGFLSSPVYAIQYCNDFLEDGNPGGWGMSPKTFDDTWLLCFIGEEVELDVWINDVPEPLLQAGFWMTYDPLFVNVVGVEVYDGIDLPGPWDPAYTVQVPDQGLGTCFVAVASQVPVSPDSEGDIIIAKVRFRGEGMPGSAVTISPMPSFDTIVGESDTVFDPEIIPSDIMLQVGCPPCAPPEVSPPNVELYMFSDTQQFSLTFSCCECYTPQWYWSDDCSEGDIDQSGLFHVGTITASEICSVCVTDLANTGMNDCSEVTINDYGDVDQDSILDPDDNCLFTPNGPSRGTCTVGTIGEPCVDNEECGPGGLCIMDQEDTYPPGGNECGDACECEGNFDDDLDQDGSDAAKFKIDFGRSPFFNPCSNTILCNGDFDCDADVDGTDAAKFKEDFGRSPFSYPCWFCPTDPWCMYEGNPFINNYSDSGCLGASSQSGFDQEGECANEDRVTAEVVENSVMVTNTVYFNCCSGIEVELTADGNYLNLLTMENPFGTCFCTCCFRVETEISGLASGEYTIVMCWTDWGSGYNCEMETVVVSE